MNYEKSNINQAATTFKPFTGKVSNNNYLVLCWEISACWCSCGCYFGIYHPPTHCLRPSTFQTWRHQSLTAVASPAGHSAAKTAHQWLKEHVSEQDVELASELPISMGCTWVRLINGGSSATMPDTTGCLSCRGITRGDRQNFRKVVLMLSMVAVLTVACVGYWILPFLLTFFYLVTWFKCTFIMFYHHTLKLDRQSWTDELLSVQWRHQTVLWTIKSGQVSDAGTLTI